MTDLDAQLTELLRDMRHQAGLTGADLANRIGWHGKQRRTVVSNYECGRYIPGLELVGRWAAACGLHAELVITPRGTGSPWVVPLNDGPQP
jgi:transcriptional regulator with XRE-family HTH domain